MTSQASDVGLTYGAVREHLRHGLLRRLFRRVVVDAAAADTAGLRLEALALVVPRDAMVGDHTAAWLWGADTRPPHMLRELRPTLIAAHGHTRPPQQVALVRQSTIPDADLVEMRGVRVTSPRRTALDLLRLQWRPHALAAADAMVRDGVVDHLALLEGATQLGRLPGRAQARELVQCVDPRADSHGESWMRCRILDAGLPRPVLQHETVLRDGRVRYLDAAWPEQRVGSEYDGRAHHVSGSDVEHDMARRAELEEELYWRIVIAKYAGIFGTDESFERELGALLGVDVRPRRW